VPKLSGERSLSSHRGLHWPAHVWPECARVCTARVAPSTSTSVSTQQRAERRAARTGDGLENGPYDSLLAYTPMNERFFSSLVFDTSLSLQSSISFAPLLTHREPRMHTQDGVCKQQAVLELPASPAYASRRVPGGDIHDSLRPPPGIPGSSRTHRDAVHGASRRCARDMIRLVR